MNRTLQQLQKIVCYRQEKQLLQVEMSGLVLAPPEPKQAKACEIAASDRTSFGLFVKVGGVQQAPLGSKAG